MVTLCLQIIFLSYFYIYLILSFVILACKGAAKMLFTGTLTLGCKSYLDSQSKACYCGSPSYGWKDKRNRHYTMGADKEEL